MDVGLYREDEQFSFTASGYLDSYSSDSTSFTIEQHELFEDIRPMSQPPPDIFDWHSDETDKELNSDVDMIDRSNICNDDALDVSPMSKDDLHKILGLQNWQNVWQPTTNLKLEDIPIDANCNAEKGIINNKTPANLQNIEELPDLTNNLHNPHVSLPNIKVEDNCKRISLSLSESSDNTLNESSRRESESSDVLNASFGSTELINFDITEYVFEENKQTKKSIEGSNTKTELVKIKNEPVFEEHNVNVKPDVNFDVPKRVVKAGMKKIDLKAQKYIIERDIKKSFSEDECDIDIETISEEENSPILEAGNLTDLLEQFEATEVKNNEQVLTNGKYFKGNQQNLSLNVKVQIKAEKDESTMQLTKPVIKLEPKFEMEQCEEKTVIKLKQEKPEKSYQIQPGINISQSRQINQQKSKEQFSINNKLSKSIVKIQETTTSSKTPSASSNRQILDYLPQELINRIKESGKRKPITVIQPIPNNRKKCKIQEPIRTLPPTSSETVHLDHNYCSISSSPSNKVIKKDSGFVSSEEDDRAIISRQPTVKNADGTLMVSLLKANTIRHLEPTKNQKKKLNLEEYKKRRNGLLTSRNNSQNCSPNTSTCSSPLPEDEHQKMLKHQEKLRKMAQEVLNAAPKSEKKVEPQSSLLKVLGVVPLSPASSVKSISQPGSPAISKDLPVKKEVAVKTTHNKVIKPIKAELLVKPDIPIDVPVTVEPPKVPPNLERKVVVSFGVNTDFRIAKNEDPLAPVEKLQEIKPLLEKANCKISENSLITSVIENIPKVINKNEKPDESKSVCQTDHYEHGECKQVIYLEKDRVRCETKDAATQTNISLIEQSKRGRKRRRVSSSSSCSSDKSQESASSRRSRKSSDSSSSSRSSVTSRSSTSSSSSRSSEYSSRNSSRLSYSRSRSRSPKYNKRRRNSSAEREHLNAVEERRIIYVGKIATGTTKEDLRRKFQKFGPINKISLHFREIGENYGFVTFKYKEDAHKAYEHGNDDPSYPCYKISFGGRREFCKAAYSDLDNMRDDAYYQSQTSGDSYDKLLKEALEKLKKRKV